MIFDRSRFLVLVTAIAAATACTTKDDDGTGGAGGAGTGGEAGEGGRGGAGTGGDGAGGEGGAPACDDSVGAPVCMSACEGFDSCTPLIEDLKPRVAESVAGCLSALDQAVCVEADVEGCIRTGLAAACADATADDDCAAIAPGCGASPDDAAWQAECHGLIDGLTDDARGLVATCASDGVSCDPAQSGSLWVCVSGLRF